MKIVIDTNVFISGVIATTGIPAIVLERALSKHEVLISDYILEEFQSKMLYKLHFSKEELENAVAYLKRRCLLVAPHSVVRVDFSDKKDIPTLELVAFSKPNYFITGDKKLLLLKKQGLAVFLSPREAMEMI